MNLRTIVFGFLIGSVNCSTQLPLQHLGSSILSVFADDNLVYDDEVRSIFGAWGIKQAIGDTLSDGKLLSCGHRINFQLLPAMYTWEAHQEFQDVTCSVCKESIAEKILFNAAERGSIELGRLVITLVKDLNKPDKCGLSPLHYAARQGHADMVELLISWKADKDVQSLGGRHTALHFAAKHGYEGIIIKLLSSGADKFRRSKDGYTASDLASEDIKILLEAPLASFK